MTADERAKEERGNEERRRRGGSEPLTVMSRKNVKDRSAGSLAEEKRAD